MSGSSRFAVAVRTLTLLASRSSAPLKSEQIAARVNTNAVVIRRILCVLSNAALVMSQTGASGGSRLARPPAQITLLDVHRALGQRGPSAMRRRAPDKCCPIGMNIEWALEDVLKEVDLAIEHVLAGVTIKDALQKIRACARGGRKR